MPPPIITEGTGYVLFAYDVAHAFDLAAAETRLASATQRQTVKQKRRGPAFFQYYPPSLLGAGAAGSLARGRARPRAFIGLRPRAFPAGLVGDCNPPSCALTGA